MKSLKQLAESLRREMCAKPCATSFPIARSVLLDLVQSAECLDRIICALGPHPEPECPPCAPTPAPCTCKCRCKCSACS